VINEHLAIAVTAEELQAEISPIQPTLRQGALDATFEVEGLVILPISVHR